MDDITKEIRSLCKYIVSEHMIDHVSDSNGADCWRCPFCLNTAPVIYVQPTTVTYTLEWLKMKPCDLVHFPHAADCEVLRARRILVVVGRE